MSFFNTRVILVIGAFCLVINAKGQKFKIRANGFGHVEYKFYNSAHENDSYFSLGEQSLFVNGTIAKNISFLGEYTVTFNQHSPTSFSPNIHRSLVKFNYYRNHSLIAGKVHTPLNYWNDVFHHGRLFYPTIDRPSAFKYFVPMHTIGLQLQGQNLGALNFGYDIVIGNGISSTDVFNDDLVPSFSAALQIKPIDGMRISVSFYHDLIKNNVSGAHTGHATPSHIDDKYDGDVLFQLYSGSFAYFGKHIEILNEFSFNRTQTDSLGTAKNFANYLYLGYRIKDKYIPFVMTDFMVIDEIDLHSYPFDVFKLSVGYKHEFSHLLNIKIQYERYTSFNKLSSNSQMNFNEFKIQLSYSI